MNYWEPLKNATDSTPTIKLRWLAAESERIRFDRRMARIEAGIAGACVAVWLAALIEIVKWWVR